MNAWYMLDGEPVYVYRDPSFGGRVVMRSYDFSTKEERRVLVSEGLAPGLRLIL